VFLLGAHRPREGALRGAARAPRRAAGVERDAAGPFVLDARSGKRIRELARDAEEPPERAPRGGLVRYMFLIKNITMPTNILFKISLFS
jgi:hypothetical protein